ncbi:MAG TPA: helix-turn-helix domain-containing protein [Ktedonobacterales bacterium]
MTDDLAEAEAVLRQWPEYAWLTESGVQWYRVGDVADHLGMSRETMRAMCERGAIPGAVNYGQQLGWRIPRSGLLRYLAGLARGGRATGADA